jgi:ribosomal protein L14
MILKLTWLNLADTSSILWIKTFQLYGGFSRRVSKPGNFIKGSVRSLRPQREFYKGYKFKKVKKGFIRRTLILRSRYNYLNNNLIIQFSTNTGCLIKKKNIVPSPSILGPGIGAIRNKRLLNLFKIRF